MPKPIQNISAGLYEFLRNRFELECTDAKGRSTTDPEDMKIFAFDFTALGGKDAGCVVISLLDDGESTSSLKIYFGQELADAAGKIQEEWFDFIMKLRQFAKTHMLGFDIRNINKSRITYRDIEPMFESSFGPIDGTVKTSRQPLENMEIIIKHTAKVDPEIRNSRSRRIQKIYLANNKGERFLLPFRSLMAARAMARHIQAGGTPYDSTGIALCHLVEEMLLLNRFYRAMKNVQFEDSRAQQAIASARERYMEIKKQIAGLTSKAGYEKNAGTLNSDPIEFDDEEYNSLFGNEDLDENLQMALPHVMRAYHTHAKLEEQEEFEKWAAAAKGQIDDQEPLMGGEHEENDSEDDDYFDPELISEADVPTGGAWASPLTNPYTKIPNHFHSKKEIDKLKNTTGKMSPFSLLNKKEEDPDYDFENDLDSLIHLAGQKQPK